MKNSIVKESWKPVCGFEGKYEVSDISRVRSLNYNHTGKTKVLKPRVNKGYLRVTLCKNGKRKSFSVHTLVFWAFKGPIPPGMTVDHINGDKLDNRPENLQLLSRGDNTRKARLGKRLSEEHRAKLSFARLGKTHNEETKARMSAAQKGKKFTEEHKAKLRAAAKARWSGINRHKCNMN